jgi:nucleoid-associated protein YgaU
MPKDLKIGLAVGLGFVIVAVLWLATRPSLTPQARLASAPPRRAGVQNLHNADARKQTSAQADSDISTNENQHARVETRASDIQKMTSSNQNPVTSIEIPESPTRPVRDTLPQSIQNEPTEPEPIQTEKFYIVRKNDTLSSISQKYYGTARQWPKIFDANRNRIADANKLAIGTKLIIPD